MQWCRRPGRCLWWPSLLFAASLTARAQLVLPDEPLSVALTLSTGSFSTLPDNDFSDPPDALPPTENGLGPDDMAQQGVASQSSDFGLGMVAAQAIRGQRSSANGFSNVGNYSHTKVQQPPLSLSLSLFALRLTSSGTTLTRRVWKRLATSSRGGKSSCRRPQQSRRFICTGDQDTLTGWKAFALSF